MIVSQPHLPDLLEWHGNHCEGDDEHHIFSIPPGICLLGSMQVQLGHRKPVTGFHWKSMGTRGQIAEIFSFETNALG
eukprot:scaffold204179_cov18-Tisochrysis_lutea.AAC.1